MCDGLEAMLRAVRDRLAVFGRGARGPAGRPGADRPAGPAARGPGRRPAGGRWAVRRPGRTAARRGPARAAAAAVPARPTRFDVRLPRRADRAGPGAVRRRPRPDRRPGRRPGRPARLRVGRPAARCRSWPRCSWTSACSGCRPRCWRRPGRSTPDERRPVDAHPEAGADADPPRVAGRRGWSPRRSPPTTSGRTGPATRPAARGDDLPSLGRMLAVCDAYAGDGRRPPAPPGRRPADGPHRHACSRPSTAGSTGTSPSTCWPWRSTRSGRWSS